MAEAGITGIDESRDTSDKSSSRSRKDVKPYMWPVCAKVAKISEGQGEPIQNSAIGPGHQPTHNNAGEQ